MTTITALPFQPETMPPKEKTPPNKRTRRNPAPVAFTVTAPLRFLLHQLELRLGHFPPGTAFDGQGRFHAPVLPEVNAELPPAMASVFAEELAGLDRIGKKPARCRFLSLPPLSLFYVGYYYFDGFNALLFAELDGEFFAAWKEQEMHGERSPETIITPGDFDRVQTVFGQALSFPS